MFKIGDKAVHPAHGVGVIKGIEEREVLGVRQAFIILHIMKDQQIVLVPRDRIGAVGLRDVISKDEVKQVYKILRSRTRRFTANRAPVMRMHTRFFQGWP